MKKIICISHELNKHKSTFLKKTGIKECIVLKKNAYSQIKKLDKNKEIHIYDIEKKIKKIKIKTITHVNNHVNKTGANPIRGVQKKIINFYDITQIYKQSKEGKIADCFGSNELLLSDKKKINAFFLCNYAICAHVAGFRKIYGYVVS